MDLEMKVRIYEYAVIPALCFIASFCFARSRSFKRISTRQRKTINLLTEALELASLRIEE